MDKQDVKNFFDQQSVNWDAEMIRNDDIIGLILDNAGCTPENAADKKILDVACGTGVLIPDYLNRGFENITAIDISEGMIEIAKAKYPQVSFICGDVETTEFPDKFDIIVLYNAFPHFPSSVNIIETLSSLLKEGGYLTVAHGMSRKQIDNHHRGKAAKVSNGLISASVLAKIFKYFEMDVITEISDDLMYQVTGIKRK